MRHIGNIGDRLQLIMIFSLFNKKQKPAHVGSCPLCSPSEMAVTQSPFQVDKPQLTNEYDHENVNLARCRYCGSLALCYSADVFDDYWIYWCLIDESDRTLLLAPDDDKNPERPSRAREIIARRPTLINHPVRGFEWAPSGTRVITGPPW